MKAPTLLICLFVNLLFLGCNTTSKPSYEVNGAQSKIVVGVIEAVNEKNAEKYVSGFAENVQIFLDSELKIEGRENIKNNRAKHFNSHPDIRSEIQHIVEIDHKVILHDKVWLDASDQVGQNIVEIFTFENGKIIRVDVIQPSDL